jgi:hypothetical protein
MVVESIDAIEVSASSQGRSGFQITFRVGRDSKLPIDFDLMLGPLLQPFSRIVLIVTFNGIPSVLMDGIITNRQLSPGQQPGTSTLSVTGEDVSVMMDLEEKSEEHPAQPEAVIALKLISTYAQYGLIPMVIPPPSIDMPLPIERTPVQQDTDLDYLKKMADRYGYVFYVEPGPAPLTNTAYWGPPVRAGVPQRALSANVGPNTNVNSINFSYNALAPEFVEGQVQDRRLNETIPVRTFASTRPPLASQPAWLTQSHTRVRQFRESGVDTVQAFARAQGQTDESNDTVLTATGELDAIRYQSILRPRGLVGLRGVGYAHDGLYYVENVSHSISDGSYTQSFTLTREGVGSITPVVIP